MSNRGRNEYFITIALKKDETHPRLSNKGMTLLLGPP
jgi:hypothetical protein